MIDAGIALQGLAATAAIGFATWIASLVRRDASLVDRVWSLAIAASGLAMIAALPATGPRAPWLIGLALVWALRLAAYISWRNWGHGEDRRYQTIRARNEPGFALKSLVLVFGLQAVLAWIVSAPLVAGAASPAPLGWLDAAGLALAVFGIGYEAVADAQMARFKARPESRGRVMDRGLWATSRHPNYFGECCVWWGLGLAALAGGGAWSLVSPLLMTLLLLKVSGVALLERDLAARGPEYRSYIARTNAFVPGPRRAGGESA